MKHEGAWSRLHEPTLAVQKKCVKISFFFSRKKFKFIPKYWGKQIFSLASFPEVGQKQKREKKKKDRTKVVSVNNVQVNTWTKSMF